MLDIYPLPSDTPTDLVLRVHRYLTDLTSRPWLLLLDNVTGAGAPELPDRGGMVVATSQETVVWGPEREYSLELPALEEADIQDLLQGVLPQKVHARLLPPALAPRIYKQLKTEFGSSTYSLYVIARTLAVGSYENVDEWRSRRHAR